MKTATQIRWVKVIAWAIIGFGLGFILERRLSWALAAMVLFALIRYGIGRYRVNRQGPHVHASKPLSPKMAAHYQAAGLTASEIELFRTTMSTAATQIDQVEAIASRVPKLEAIAVNTDLIAVLHAFFKAIVNQPKRMSHASHFLYEKLPNLLDIMTKYDTISKHEVKTADTYAVLTTAANAVSDLANSIRTEYAAFVKTDVVDLEAALALARKQETASQPLHERI